MKTIMAVFFALIMCSPSLTARDYKVVSPNGQLTMTVEVNDEITYSLSYNDKELIKPSLISMKLYNGEVLGKTPQIKGEQKNEIDESIKPWVKQKFKEIKNRYNELVIEFEGNYALIFRVYDDGAAYRFRTTMGGEITVENEDVNIKFPESHDVVIGYEDSYLTHSERLYPTVSLYEADPERFACLPLLVLREDGLRLAIMESALYNYPGLLLTKGKGDALKGLFAPYPQETKQTRDRTVEVSQYADYIAKTDGTRDFPWRAFMVAENDARLLENMLVYKLGTPPAGDADFSWVKPGKVAWDWWNAWNIYGVDFEAGINTQTYKYYIDFASEYGLEYIILDEGWSDPADLKKMNPDINIEELVAYANEKNVGIILWVVWKSFDDELDWALETFSKWGIKGVKVDFMQRDDQWMVEYYERVARRCAEHQLLVDFHGSYKPAGLRRTYPNVITREGVMGLENSKWSYHVTPDHDLTIPFTRGLAGPMDYTPGAMRNAMGKNFCPRHTRPMSQGTRCHQLAMYVIYDSPLQMLCDNPSNYYNEPECMKFLGPVPAVWDDTKALDAKAGDFILMARRDNVDWYLGAMTDSTAREFTVQLDFLGDGVQYIMEVWQDGLNAHRFAEDFTYLKQKVRKDDEITIQMAPGGGYVARFKPLIGGM